MEPDGPPVNYGITTHHRSAAKAKQFDTAGVLSFYGKNPRGASPMPHVLGRSSALKGMSGE